MLGSKVYVGVDIGGTKTHIRAVDEAGAEENSLIRSSEWRSRDWDTDAKTLVAMIQHLVAGRVVIGLGVGAHGCDDADECAQFEASLSKFAEFPIIVRNDAEILPASLGYSNGIGVVAGTGSIAVARNKDGQMITAGGWGWVIGDNGSASGLVREAASKVARYLDQGGDSTELLVQALRASLGVSSPPRLGSAIADCGSAARVGEHATAVFEAASAGSALASEAIDEGAHALVDLVGNLLNRGAEASIVVAGGAVMANQPLLSKAFVQGIRREFGDRISVEVYGGPPVQGACNLARSICGATELKFPASASPNCIKYSYDRNSKGDIK